MCKENCLDGGSTGSVNSFTFRSNVTVFSKKKYKFDDGWFTKNSFYQSKTMKHLKISISFLFLIVIFSACKKKDVIQQGSSLSVSNEKVILNPTGYSPLAANISLETSLPTRVSIRVVGKHGTESDVVKDFDTLSALHNFPVLGLYPGYSNTVELIFKDASGAELKRTSYTLLTSTLPAGTYPDITINTKKTGQITAGMTLVSYFGYKDNIVPQTPFIFDAFGDIRWYLDFHSSSILNGLFYDDGMERLQNDNLYFGDTHTNTIYEMNFLGAIVNTWTMPGYSFHHNVQEKPNGNFLVTVSKQGSSTDEDYIIEIDRATKQIIKTWDLNQSLQYGRQTLTTEAVDWIHVNAIIYDASDNTIIISGRTQALVKLDANNNVVWIMGCHKGWGNAGNGADLNNYLLQPLDKNNAPITDQNVLDGNTNHPDFEWNWYQHAPLLMPNNHVMLFDNGGDNRNFSGAGQYSRAVEYDINAANKTVKQIWEYGKERGTTTFSHIVSDVDFISSNNHVIFSPGAINNSVAYGEVIELDYTTQEVLFEATLTPVQTLAGIVFHRTERLKLYP
ncbi:MAG: aryl-sulfate sulfotransferase [Ginsengibacter sp.]